MSCTVDERHLMLVLNLAMPANIIISMRKAVLAAVCWLFQNAMLELMYCFRAWSVVLLITEPNMLVPCMSCPSGWANDSSLHTASPYKLWRLRMSPCMFMCVWWYAEQNSFASGQAKVSYAVHQCAASHIVMPLQHLVICISMWSQDFSTTNCHTSPANIVRRVHQVPASVSQLRVPAAQMPHDMLFS